MNHASGIRGTVVGAVALAGLVAIAARAAVEYPGPPPGPAVLEYRDGRLAATNSAICMAWTFAGHGLRPAVLRDVRSGKDLLPLPGGEAFRIVLSNGQSHAASSLEVVGDPRIQALIPDPKASRLAARLPGRRVEVSLQPADRRFRAVWSAVLHDGANYVRQELVLTAVAGDLPIREIVWMEGIAAAGRVAGRVDGSPVIAGDFFLGCEDPHAIAAADPISFRMVRNAPLGEGETLAQSCVAGVAPPGQMRRAFLHCLERERAHPFRTFLHYNSWYDISWRGALFDEATSREAIRLFGERMIEPHGAVMDSMVFDDGWDDPKTLWQFNSGFPRGFAPLVAPCRKYGTRLGVWLSPFGGYGELKQQRLAAGAAQGYETNATGFAMSGPRYYAAFKRACVGMIRDFGVNHFKFDGIAAGTQANGGADYVRDTEAMRRLMLELRDEAPDLYINLTTGSWPSPFWLCYADSIWRQGHDMNFAGKGPKQQQWLTYRDQEVFRNIVEKGPLFPLNSLMSQGVAYSRHGMAGDPAFDAAGFSDDVHAFFGSGTGLQELYIQPGRLTAADWSVLAEAAKWARARADILADTHWIGGDPSKPEVYGYASWAQRGGVVMLRNPDDRPRNYSLDIGAAFELPAGAPTRYALKSPWISDAARPAWTAEAGRASNLTLAPFEVLVVDAVPLAGTPGT